MRNETLLKIIIAVFAVILIVLGSFAYGNMQRANLASDTTTKDPIGSHSEVPAESDSAAEPAKLPANDLASAQTPAPAPSPAPVTTHPAQKSQMPTTGGESAIVPMTALATLGYLLWRARRLAASVRLSKSR